MSNANSNGKNGTSESESPTYLETRRLPGEPPERFPFDREVVADVMAWHQACPNFRMGTEEVPYSRARYIVVMDPSMTDVPHQHRVRASLKPGAEAEPQADPEDTDAVLKQYERWRARYKTTLGRGNRQYVQGEPRPGPVTSVATAGNAARPGDRMAGLIPEGFSYPKHKNRL